MPITISQSLLVVCEMFVLMLPLFAQQPNHTLKLKPMPKAVAWGYLR